MDGFLNHICLDICFRLFTLLEKFAVVDFPFKLFLNEKLDLVKKSFAEGAPTNHISEEACLL